MAIRTITAIEAAAHERRGTDVLFRSKEGREFRWHSHSKASAEELLRLFRRAPEPTA